MLRKAVFLPLLALLLSPAAGHALGLGEVRVLSSLNEPLAAEIALTDLRAGELDELQVRLASLEAFQRVGLDRPFLLTQLQFTATRNAAGQPVVSVTTRDAVREPFLLFLIEANWSRGRLLREYTVLLDPPVLMPAVVSAVQPARSTETGAARSTPPASDTTTRRMPESFGGRIPEDRMRAGPGSYGAIQRDETLWSIAERVKPSADITTSQMMLALFDANPDAFYGNINRMKTGYILRVPGADVAMQRSAAEAVREVQRQNEAWRTGEATDFRIAEAGPGNTDRLRLSAPSGDADGDDPAGTADGTGDGLQRRLAEAESAVAEEREARETLTDRLVELEEEAERLRNQLQIRNAEIAALTGEEPEPVRVPETEPPATETDTPATTEPAADEPATTEPAATEAEPKPDARTQVRRPPEPEPTIIERLMNPLVLGGLLGILVLIGLAVTVVRRRRATAEANKLLAPDADDEATQFAAVDAEGEQTVIRDDDAMAPAEPAPADAEPEPEPESEPTGEDHTASGIVRLDESDPTSEADFHLAYGLYDQAADLMEGAYKDHPDRVPYLMKLLEIYFAWGKADEFVAHAREGKAKLEAAGEWGNVAILGRQMAADEPLFSGDMAATGARGGVDLDVEGGANEMDIDTNTFGGDDGFDLGEPDAEDAPPADDKPAGSAAPAGNEMEFDLGDFEYPTDETPAEAPAADAGGDDVGLEMPVDEAPAAAPDEPAAPEPTAADDANELEFDMDLGDAEEPGDNEATQFKVDPNADDSALDMDLDSALAGLGAEESDAIETALAGDEGTGDTDFDLDALGASDDDGAQEIGIDDAAGDGDAADLDFDSLLGDDDTGEPADAGSGDSRLDLARAYIDMGDADGARGLLNEVLADGTDEQKQEAQELLNVIS